jgi:divinyl protochlorophyllide a 8-vinyl-reductase
MTDEALIGPNAIIQVADAIRREFGLDRLVQIMHAARLAHFVATPPAQMVNEVDVVRLHQAVASSLPEEAGRAVMWQAGENTAAYLLANRIPALAQTLLRLLPASVSARLLLRAIGRHAWTFAGSSTFGYSTHPATVQISLAGSPLFATPACRVLAEAYFMATFETLLRELVSSRTRAAPANLQTADAKAQDASGTQAACAFELDWAS